MYQYPHLLFIHPTQDLRKHRALTCLQCWKSRTRSASKRRRCRSLDLWRSSGALEGHSGQKDMRSRMVSVNRNYWTSICLFVCLSIYLSIYLAIYLSICVYLYSYLYIYICNYILLSIYMYNYNIYIYMSLYTIMYNHIMYIYILLSYYYIL